jgi:Zn-dependent protease with chaperone function
MFLFYKLILLIMKMDKKTMKNTEAQRRERINAWESSPQKDKMLIKSGRYLNVGFVFGSMLAAPASLAASPWVAMGCLVAAAAAGVGYIIYKTKDMDSSLTNIVDGVKAPKGLQQLAEDVFARGGLRNIDVDVRVIEENKSPIRKLRMLPYTAAVDISKKDRAKVLIGKKLLENLSNDEIEAVLCHEASHMINRKNTPGTHWSEQLGRFSLTGMFLASAVTFNFAGMAYYGAASIGSFLFNKSLKRVDEYRADYNAVGLSQKPDAMISGLTTVYNTLVRAGNKHMPQAQIDRRMKLNNMLWPLASHPPVPDRLEHIRNVARKHNIACSL